MHIASSDDKLTVTPLDLKSTPKRWHVAYKGKEFLVHVGWNFDNDTFVAHLYLGVDANKRVKVDQKFIGFNGEQQALDYAVGYAIQIVDPPVGGFQREVKM